MFGVLACSACEIEKVARGDGIEREALAQVFGAIELPVLDPSTGLESPEALLDGPLPGMPSNRLHGVVQCGLPIGAQQQSLQQRLAGRVDSLVVENRCGASHGREALVGRHSRFLAPERSMGTPPGTAGVASGKALARQAPDRFRQGSNQAPPA